MVYKWNNLKEDFIKEIITLYLKGCKEMENKSIEIYNPKDENYKIFIDLYVPKDVLSENVFPSCTAIGDFFGSVLKIKGSIIEIFKEEKDSESSVVFNFPILENDLSVVWKKLKSYKEKNGNIRIRSIDTEDLINEIKHKGKDFLMLSNS